MENLQGIVGQALHPADIAAALEGHDMFLYCGHGCGEKYLPQVIPLLSEYRQHIVKEPGFGHVASISHMAQIQKHCSSDEEPLQSRGKGLEVYFPGST